MDGQALLDGLRKFVSDDREGYTRGLTNPVTGQYERLEQLPDDGYKRRFLELLIFLRRPDLVDLGASPFLAFDRDRWALYEREGAYILTKREPETRLDEMVIGQREER